MEKPDKIYVHSGQLAGQLGIMQATAIPVKAPDETEYIRKDTLVNWLESMANLLTFAIEGLPSPEQKAREEAYRRVIDFINSK